MNLKQEINYNQYSVYIYLFLICLTYPVLFFVPPPYLPEYSKLLCVNDAVLVTYAISALCFKISEIYLILRKNKVLTVLTSILILIPVYHYLINSNYTIEYLFTSLRWGILSLFVIVYYDSFKKIFPYFLSFLWIVNLLHSLSLYLHNIEFYGLACNRNWHASFLIVTTPCVSFILFNKLKYIHQNTVFAKYAKLLSLLPIIITVPILIGCKSRGAILSLCIASLVILYIKLSSKYRKIMRISILGGFLILFVFFNSILRQEFHKIDMTDIRIPLWKSTISLIQDNILIGTGEPSFESKLTPHLIEDFFLRHHAAPRSINPHNNLLYIFACYGIISLFAWLIFNFYALKSFFTNKSISYDKLLYLFVFICLFIHGNLDLILFKWPTNYLFFITLGLLVYDALHIPKQEELNNVNQTLQNNKIFNPLFFTLLSIPFCCISIFFIQQNLRSSQYRIYANIAEKNKDFAKTLSHYDKSIQVKKVPLTIYKTANFAFQTGNYPLTIKYLKLLETTPKYNIAYSNELFGTTYCMMRQEQKALPYFRANVAKFKLSIKSWYFLFKVQKYLKKYKEAYISLQNIHYSMRLHNLKFEHLPALLLDNSETYDIHPYKLLKKKVDNNQYKDIYKGLIKEFNEIKQYNK